jgi:hypothetical protein
MDFGQALDALRSGLPVSRIGWNGSGMWIVLSPGCHDLKSSGIWTKVIRDYVMANGDSGKFRPYFMMKTAQGDFVPWVASQTDLLAEDWRVVEV